ncbi:hypothetical protein KFL_000210150 [Klebsormidium nitens]|uniref:RING-type E3 ubiquitin transferase n=1 Tax=Klebsormidium nitens TaxID=105231 RepID=A0A1Y1HNZ6_KLENI|nr:hypothetical protein KFL_000210150 [Klebsormidium nitens]|eukprot:GAQ78929.1 hypothetical protein KFL_000210150 [Klebsormidium nitens]
MAEALTALAGLATIVQMAIAAGMKAKSHKHNVQALVRRLKLVPPLIEEVRASRTPLTEAQLNVFENLEHAMQRAKDLLTKCSENSKLYMIFRGDSIVQKFRDVGLDLDRCLSALPLVQLKVSDGTLEKIEEVSVALRETKFKVDVVDQNLSLKIAEALKEQREAQQVNEDLLRSLATQLDLTTVQASRAEEKGLLRDREEARAEKERGEEAYINQIIHLLDTLELADSSSRKESPKSVLVPPPQPPDEFRCPVSLDLMADPVILDSGHTFERAYIQKWLDDGHRTCPISRKPLMTLKLIPNQTLKGMIITWCEKNHVPLPTLPVLRMEPLADVAPSADVAREADVAPAILEGFKGLRFNNDFSGSSAEWEEYEIAERGSKKRRGISKFEEELSRFAGHQTGLAELFGKPGSRRSKANEMIRGVEAAPQRLMLYNIETESGGSGPIAEGLAFGASNADAVSTGPSPTSGQSSDGSKNRNSGQLSDRSRNSGQLPDGLKNSGQFSDGLKNSGQFSDGFSALGDLYNSGSLKLGDPDAYASVDIRDLMCESPLRDDVIAPIDDVSIPLGDGLLGFGGGEQGPGDSSPSRGSGLFGEPKFRLSWARRNSENKLLLPEMCPSTSYQAELGSLESPQGLGSDPLGGVTEQGYQGMLLKPHGFETQRESGKERVLEEGLRLADGHSGPQDGYQEKRSLPLDFLLETSPSGGQSHRHGHKEHLRPLARGGASVHGVKKGGVSKGAAHSGSGHNREGLTNGVFGIGSTGNGGLDWAGGMGGIGGQPHKESLQGALAGAGEVSAKGGGGVNGLRVTEGVKVQKGGAHGGLAGDNSIDGVSANRAQVANGLGANGHGANGLGANGHRPPSLTARTLSGAGGVSSRRTFSQQLHHFDWEIDGLESSPSPPELIRGAGALLNGRDRSKSSRRSSDPVRQEGRLESAAVHRRGASLPQEPAGPSPPLRSPRSPPMCPILDDFLLDAPAQSPREFGHRVTAPAPDVRAAARTDRPGSGGDKPKPYLTTPEEVTALLDALDSDDVMVKRHAAEQLRALGKNSNANRATIAAAGAIPLLLGMIDSPDALVQEHAITAILNLSINDVNKTALTVAGAIPALVEVLASPWSSGGAKEAAAATLFSLSVMDDCKVTIGDAGAIPHLVDLLRNGTPRGRKDAVTALFNLSIFSGNKVRILKAKAVPLLVTLVRDTSVREKCVAVLANLSTMKDGRSKIGDAGGVAVLVDQVEVGTPRSKENAAATLLQMGVNSSRYTAEMIQAGAISPLLALSQDGTPRAKEKALALIRHFREQRKGEAVRGHPTDQGVGSL